ncbi:MAG: response regulator [Alphaproteobacteria bacterium]|nr:MAG: response regulator [Alphaproteobacteria bacterium]
MAKKYDLANLNILLVDDNKNMHSIIKYILMAMDIMQFRSCQNADEAFQQMREQPPDILITEYKLPGQIDGFEMIRRIRRGEDGPAPYLPILVLTGHADLPTVIASRNAGATEFLAKPVSAGSLYDRIIWMIENPRPFIKAKEYIGPDRRRAMRGYEGLERRGPKQRVG